MSIVIYKKIESSVLEKTLKAVESHKPITCFGAKIRHEIRNNLKPLCSKHIDTAKEYEDYLAEHGVLIEEPV